MLTLIIILLVVQRLVELRIAARNARASMAQGGKEYGTRHYPLFIVLHTTWFVAMVVESTMRTATALPNPVPWWWWTCIVVVIVAQGLRYWAITTLGEAWNTRIIVVPGRRPIERGPYRVMKHPNYVAVTAELLCIPLLVGAPVTAVVVSILNAILLLGIRIPMENEALEAGGKEA